MKVALTLLFGLICLIVGVCVGMEYSSQLKATEAGRRVTDAAGKLPWAKSIAQSELDSSFEKYDYPTIKWRAKPLTDAPGAIAQLSTTYDQPSKSMKYRLTLFKAPNKNQAEIQLLDGQGFKLMQLQASDFHAVPGAPDVNEARDSFPCGEEQYKQASDYSIK